ncbi:hypothetical protein H6F76_02685 [Leptolyngbya sp. FACHB-321]|uniref:DUF5691 domain-containing protein n=1 Tax=Leptolyngbya sp. FACHB-321 TaxID=2692807 RepID=UPI001689EDFE|nr:DUF5691 domain-containing protein [Leptolyngbya sp. FACHB-321]MBD2033956.1 hypothetical protein [Leptolyngbya sp. FACHB-321]
MVLATDSPWQTIAAAALLGTERQPFQIPSISGDLGTCLSQLGNCSNESALLSAIGIVSIHQRVGWLPEVRSVTQVKSCSSDDFPRCSPRAARHLQQILEGQFPHLLSEWLEKAAIAGQRVPEMLLPSLLDKGRQQRELRSAILSVLGQRGRWLAAQNPNWNYAVALTTEADWETGTPSARLLYLQNLRSHNPDRVRELLQSTWKQETASDRAKFLEALHVGLSMADEPFLEDGLGDRSKEVRRVAVDLLASLPDSRLCHQVTKHTCRYLSLEREMPSLHVQLPDYLDETLIQFGFELKPLSSVNNKVGEKGWWLLQMLSATPLSTWTEQWQMSPQQIVKLAQSHEWQNVLLDGFALAAKRQGNHEWLEEVIRVWFTGQTSISRDVVLVDLGTEALIDALSADQRDALLIDLFQVFHRSINDSLVIWSLRSSSQPWSFDLARLVLDGLEEHLNNNKTFSNSDWELRSALKEFARFIPVSLTSEVIQLRARLANDSHWMNSMNDLIALLEFRKEISQAFETGN